MLRLFQIALVGAALAAFWGCSKQAAPPAGPQAGKMTETGAAPAAAPAEQSPTPGAQAAPPQSGAPSGATGQQASGATGQPGSAAPAKPPQAAAPPPPPPRVAEFRPGTALAVRTTTALDTSKAKDGDRWEGTLEKPLQFGDWVVAPKGATVRGTVVSSDPGGRVKGRASLVLAITALELADGRTVNLASTRYTREAKSTVKRDTVRTGIASGIGAAIGAIAGGGRGAAIGAGAGAAGGAGVALATRGDPARVPAESVLQFKLTAPLSVTEKR